MVEAVNDESVLCNATAAPDADAVPSSTSASPNGDTAEASSLVTSTTESKPDSGVNMDIELPAGQGDVGEVPPVAPPSPSRNVVEAMYKRLPRFYKGHKEHRTQWDHPLLTKIFDEDIASYNDVRYAAYRTALKFRALCHRLQLHQIKLTTVRNVLKQHGYEAVYQNQTLIPVVELETLMADIYLSARREYPSIDQPETNAELLLSLLLKLYDTSRYGCVKLISAKIGLALLASGSYLEKWKYILGELFDYNRSLSRKNAHALLHDVARIPEVLGEKRLFGTHLVPAAVDSLWIRGHPTTVGLPEEGFRYWLRDEPQTLVWLSTSYRIRQAERLRHFVKCSICKAYPIIGLRYRCLRCYNYNMCQSCFFTGKFNKSHRLRHPIREYCSLVSAGQETKDLIKIMKNRVFKGEQYEQKPRYMPILPDSASALEVGADSEPETDNRSRSTVPSHTSFGTPSGSVNTVNKKDFEVDVEVISELDRQGSSLDRSTTHIPRSVSEPVEAHLRFAQQQQEHEHQHQFKQLEEQEEVRVQQVQQVRQSPVRQSRQSPLLAEKEVFTSSEEEMPVMKEPSRVQTQREISQVTAQILNYAEVDVLLPKLKIVPLKQSVQSVNYSQVQVPKVPLIQERKYEDNQASRRDNSKEFSSIDYIDDSPRREPQRYDAARPTHPTSLYPAVVDKSSVQIQTDSEEFRPTGVKANNHFENNWKINGQRNAPNRVIRDQREDLNQRLAADSSESSSPELLLNGRHYRQPAEYNARDREVILENHLARLERTLVEGLGPMSVASTNSSSNGRPVHLESSSPVWKVDTRQTTNGYHKGQAQPEIRPNPYITRTTSFNDNFHQRTDSRLPPFPVESAMKAKASSDPNTPMRKLPSVPPRKESVSETGSLNGHPAYHPILDELEEKLKSLNAPLSQRDLRHPFWRHVRDKFENLLGSQVNKPASSVTYQSYGKIDKDYARTPASYGNTSHISMSHLDVTDGLLPVINQPSPNESQSSGFSSGRETDLKWEEDGYNGPVPGRLPAHSYRAVHRSKSMGMSNHRQVNDDIAQLDKLLEWLDEFKRSA